MTLTPKPMRDAEKSLSVSNDYYPAVDVVLLATGDIFRTEEVPLLAPRGMLLLCSISDRWTRVVQPLAAPHVQFGHFP